MEKSIYTTPQIERIKLDNEISLALESNPFPGPGEVYSNVQFFFNNDPFKEIS